MATNTLNTRIVSRNDTAANWTAVNPILMKGEIGIEIDTRKMKIGDGVKAWTALSYATVRPEDLSGLGYGDMLKSTYDKDNDGKVDVAKTADKLTTPRKIAGVSFDGSADISLTKANVGLGNVDNTSDINKPVSTAQKAAIDTAVSGIKGDAGTGVTLGTVDKKATDNASAITALQGRVTTAEGNISTTNSKVSTLESKTSALETKVDVAKVSTAISSAIAASEAKLGTAATKNVGTSSGNVVAVESNGKINISLIPSVAITDTFTAASEAEMLALSAAEKGDVCIRTDIEKTFILKQNGYNVLANWIELKSPTDTVTSVNGQTGTVNLTTTNIAEGTNKYYTEERASANFRTHASTELTDTASLVRITDSLILNGGNA